MNRDSADNPQFGRNFPRICRVRQDRTVAQSAAGAQICRRFNPFIWMLAGAPASTGPIMLEMFRQEIARQLRLEPEPEQAEFRAQCVCMIVARRVRKIDARKSGRA